MHEAVRWALTREERWAAGVKKVMVAAERATAVAASATAVKVQVAAGMRRVEGVVGQTVFSGLHNRAKQLIPQ